MFRVKQSKAAVIVRSHGDGAGRVSTAPVDAPPAPCGDAADFLDIHVPPVAGPDHPGEAVGPARGAQVPPAADPQALEPPAHRARAGGAPHGAP